MGRVHLEIRKDTHGYLGVLYHDSDIVAIFTRRASDINNSETVFTVSMDYNFETQDTSDQQVMSALKEQALLKAREHRIKTKIDWIFRKYR